MREILFRGKRIDKGDWVEGSLVVAGDYCCILPADEDSVHPTEYPYLNPEIGTIDGHLFPVDPLTVGQYTGLTDKNGKRIFEDDIIRANHDGAVGVVRFGEYMSPSDPDPTRHIGYYVDWQGKEKDFLRADLGYWTSRSDVEVIGNIHDNSELLEVNS